MIGQYATSYVHIATTDTSLEVVVYRDGLVVARHPEHPKNHWIICTLDGRWTEGVEDYSAEDIMPWHEVGFACLQSF